MKFYAWHRREEEKRKEKLQSIALLQHASNVMFLM